MNFEQMVNIIIPATTSISETAILNDDPNVSQNLALPICILKSFNTVFLLISITAIFNIFINKDSFERTNKNTMWIMLILTLLAFIANIISIVYYIRQYNAQIMNAVNIITGNVSNISTSISDNIEELTNTDIDFSQIITWFVYILVPVVIFFGIQHNIETKTRLNEIFEKISLETFFILSLVCLSSINEAIMLFSQNNGKLQPLNMQNIILIFLKIICSVLMLLLCAYIIFMYGEDTSKKINNVPAYILVISVAITLCSSLYSLHVMAQKHLLPECMPIFQSVAVCIFIVFLIAFIFIRYRKDATELIGYTAENSMLFEK